MNEDQRDLVAKARESLDAAHLLLRGGYGGFAAARAYYSMFYLAEALLENKGLSFSKHAAVIAAFGRHFAQPREVPAHLHRYLLEAVQLRQSGDYGAPGEVTADQAAVQIRRAEEFLAAAIAYLDPE